MTNLFTAVDVQTYLNRIVEAGTFETGSLRYRLLAHLIQEEIAGRGDALKAYAIGIDVFDKPDSFDPSTDSSVRVGMGRLRTALALFEGSGHADIALIVDVPVGTYRPILRRRANTHEHAPPPPAVSRPPRKRWRVSKGRVLWGLSGFIVGIVALAFFSFWHNAKPVDNTIALEIENFRGTPGLAETTSASLRRALANSKTITVISDNTPGDATAETDLILNGMITRIGARSVDVSIKLTAADTHAIVWAKTARFTDDALLPSRITQTIGADLRVGVFEATKQELAGRDPETLTAEQLFIMGTWGPGQAENTVEWELERVRLIGMALEMDPNFGSAHAAIADKLAYLANVHGPSNTDELRLKALIHAQRARELSPLNPDVMFNVAQALWQSGQITASKAALDRVVDLDNNHDLARFLSAMIPYTCDIPPDKVLEWAIAFNADLSKDNPIRWLTLAWISWLHTNRGEYEAALRAAEKAALIFEMPYSFMRHAMLLTKLGRPDEAAAIVMAQQNKWPDIDANHFAQITVPRLCSEDARQRQFIENYQNLADILTEKM